MPSPRKPARATPRASAKATATRGHDHHAHTHGHDHAHGHGHAPVAPAGSASSRGAASPGAGEGGAAGERRTRQREAIRAALAEHVAPMGPKELLEAAQKRVGGLGLATVYRAIKAMADDGEIVRVDVPGGAPRYELAGKAHHHHFHCRTCERVYEVEGCPGDLAAMLPRGFALFGHDLMLFGLCAACAKGAASAR